MNCEKCKNKKASVFYADDDGGQHALCAACAQSIGRLTRHSAPSAQDAVSALFTVTSSLFSLCYESNDNFILPCYKQDTDAHGDAKCPFCSSTLSAIRRSGRAGCPDCYTVFSEFLIPTVLTVDTATGARMPRHLRSSIERKRNIASLKQRMRSAVESEDFELAAALRDEIKKLEIHAG